MMHHLIHRQNRYAVQRSRVHGEGEDAALAQLALHHQFATERFGKAPADGQAQSGAAVASRDRRVGLHERIEDLLQRIGGNADTRVDHIDGQLRLALAARQARDDAHAALLGELDGIANQVGQQLPEPHRVGVHQCGQALRRFVGERDSFLVGLSAQHGHRLMDQLQGRAPDLFDVHASGFDFRQVQDVVDQIQQVLAAGVNRIEVLLPFQLVALKPAAQHIGEAEYGIHRGADLVAHAGQKIALRLVGRVRGFLRATQFLLRLLQLRDVLEARQDPTHFSVVARDGCAVDHERTPFALGVRQVHHDAGERHFVANRGFPRILQLVAGRRRDPRQVRRRPTHQPLGRLAHDVGQRLIGQHDTILVVQYEQAFSQRIERRTHSPRYHLRRIHMLQRPAQVEAREQKRRRTDEDDVEYFAAGHVAPPARRTQGRKCQFHTPPLPTTRLDRHLDLGGNRLAIGQRLPRDRVRASLRGQRAVRATDCR